MKLKRETLFRMNSNQYRSMLLAEAYTRNDSIDWLDVFKHLKDFISKDISKEGFFKYCDDLQIDLEIVKKSGEFIGGQFNLDSRRIIIIITYDILMSILKADSEELQNLTYNFWINFTHEDTHKQQQNSAKDYNIYKNYKNLTNSFWTVDLGESLDYFDQQIEADAYGREIGARLETLYKNKSLSSIFSSISANSINDDYCRRIINVYKDPRISERANKSFFRALYDFLNKNEQQVLTEDIETCSIDEWKNKYMNKDLLRN